METDSARNKRRRLQSASAIAFIVVVVIGAVLRSSGRSIGTVLLEIAAALVIVAVILLVFRSKLGKSAGALDEVRRSEPLSYPCYFDNGKRGVISAHNGELIIRRFKGKNLVDDARFPPGSYVISPGSVQLTAVRQAEGISVSGTDPSGGSLRVALSRDKMTLMGNTLAGPELQSAAASLQQGGYAAGSGPAGH